MPLPVIQSHSSPAVADLIRLFHKTDALWNAHLAEPEQLDVGTAYANFELATVHDANHIRDVSLPADLPPRQAIDLVNAHFAEKGTRCFYWVMNPSADAAQTQPLIDQLLSTGHHAIADDIMYLRKTPSEPIAQVGGLKIIPARASYRHAEALARESNDGQPVDEQRVDARMRHLDDPHWDALLALDGDRAVAHVGVFSVGEIGRVEAVHVSHTHRRRHIGQTMMSRALEICARSLFRHVFLSVAADNEPATRLYTKMGFEKIGQCVRYQRD